MNQQTPFLQGVVTLKRKLIIGNKNYSSWSLRPWILLKVKQIPFTELKVSLYGEGSKEKLLTYSPAGLVPILQEDDLTIWDSLAICEYIAENYPDKGCWPKDSKERAKARSISSEMHSGFSVLRNTMPMNCREKIDIDSISPELQKEIDRILTIWKECRSNSKNKGPFLFGSFTIADAMYAPVVSRFETYGVTVGELEREYMDHLLSTPEFQQWIEASRQEGPLGEV